MSSGHEIMMGFVWLQGTLTGDSTLMGLISNVYRGYAPPSTATPFVIMAFQSGTDVTTVNGFRMITEATYQVKAVGLAAQTAQLAAAAERLDVLLGGPPGKPAAGPIVINSVTVGQMLACYRQSPLVIDEPPINGEIWTNVGGLYRAQIEQTS